MTVPLFVVTPLCGDAELDHKLDVATCLQSMAHDGLIRVRHLGEVSELGQSEFEDANVLLCRPTTGGNGLAKHLDHLPAPSSTPQIRVIGSVSVGSPRDLQRFTIPPAYDVQTAKKATNAESVADLVVWFALESQRPFCGMGRGMSTCALHSQARNLEAGPHFRVPDIDSSRRLSELSWCFLGLGRQAQAVLRRLVAMQLRTFNVYHYAFPKDIQDGNIASVAQRITEEATEAMQRPMRCIGFQQEGDAICVNCSDELGMELSFRAYDSGEQAVQNANIISIHLRSTKQTRGFLSRSVLESVSTNAVLINTARQDIWDEDAVESEARHRGILVATDLLHPDCEDSPTVTLRKNPVLAGLPGRSGAFHGFSETFGGELARKTGQEREHEDDDYLVQSVVDLIPQSIVTRHIGGSTWGDINSIAAEVLVRCVEAVDSELGTKLGEATHISRLKERWPDCSGVKAILTRNQ